MPRSINYKFAADVSGGPSLGIEDAVEVDAYDLIEVSIPGDNSLVTVDLPTASSLRLLVITSTAYDDLEYDVNDDSGGEKSIRLDAPHILIGTGIISLLGASPARLIFRKRAGDEVKVTILVGILIDRYKLRLQREQAQPQRVEGGRFPGVEFDLERPLNEGEENKPYYVPKGPERGEWNPENPENVVKELKPGEHSGDEQAPLFFEEYDEIEDATPTAHRSVPEPSVAENGETVMTTGNFWMSLSLDGGQTFTSVNPTTIFPEDYGGFCCDQLVQYVPRFDLFVWLLQYGSSGGR